MKPNKDHRCCKSEGCPPPEPLQPLTDDPLDRYINPTTLAARIQAAFEYNGPPIDPAAHIAIPQGGTLPDRVYHLEDVPDASTRAQFGYGHFRPFEKGVIQRPDGVPWPYTPNMCLIAGGPMGKPARGVWITENYLVCPGCGLDLT
jgi:hypothetical protein